MTFSASNKLEKDESSEIEQDLENLIQQIPKLPILSLSKKNLEPNVTFSDFCI